VLLGASNSWFPVSLTVLAIPTKSEKLVQLVSDKLDVIGDIATEAELATALKVLGRSGALGGLSEFSAAEIWVALERVRTVEDAAERSMNDLKAPEWEVFTNPEVPQDWPDFMATRVGPPPELRSHIESVVLCERLREVNALVGFTRVEPPEEARDGGDPPQRAPLSNGTPEWVPATEVRGEGIFLKFDQTRLAEWMSRPAVKGREKQLLQGHRAFRVARKLSPPEDNFPGILYVLLHSFAHVFIRELALECGYSAASVRERIYASAYGESPDMAGVLVYTAAPDSDGTLGGLVDLGREANLGRIVKQALGRTRICAADPLCAEHVPTHDRSLHGAACHACSFVAETSCEIGNRYLDRALLVPSLAGDEGLAFFK